jgi:hypothetical protein
MKRNLIIFFLVLLIPMTGCMKPTTKRADISDTLVAEEEEKQREIAIARIMLLQQRLGTTSYPLLRASSEFCEDDWKAGSGIQLVNQYTFKKKFRETAVRLYELTDSVEVLYVVPDSPGHRAGVQKGDLLLKVNDHLVKPGEEAMEQAGDYWEKEVEPGQLVSMKLSRQGEIKEVEFVSDRLCDYDVVLFDSDAVNAFANGELVAITRGMLRFAETDQELSLVISHEIAHNAMSHITAKKTNAAGGFLLDLLAAAAGVNTQGLFTEMAAQAYSQDFEAEADYVGLYIMERADHTLEGAANFWRRMAAEHPSTIRNNHSASHPASAQRFVAIEETIKEITLKRDQGLAMTPEMEQDAKPGITNQEQGSAHALHGD